MKNAYEKAVNAYVEKFLECFEEEDRPYSVYWIGGHVGTIAEISDYFFDFHDIKYCVDNKIDSQKLFDYFDEIMENHYKLESIPNFPSWIKGCPENLSDKRYWSRNKLVQHKMKKDYLKEYLASNDFVLKYLSSKEKNPREANVPEQYKINKLWL